MQKHTQDTSKTDVDTSTRDSGSIREKVLAFIDLETTGLDPARHEIIEIGCILAQQIPSDGNGPRLKEINSFDIKVRPEHIETADPLALKINGYTEAGWQEAETLSSALATLSEKTIGAVPVGHNIDFDIGFLRAAYEKLGIPWVLHYKRLDTISIAYARLYDEPNLSQFSLDMLCKKLNIPYTLKHRAGSDIRATFELYKKLLGA